MADKATTNFLNARDSISSKEAVVYMTLNGKNIPLINLTECSAKWEKNKEEVQVIGRRVTGNKTTSMKGTGTLSGYLIDSNWLKYGMDFINGKSDLYFSINATINDTTSNVGSQTVLITDVNLDDIPVLNLNSDDGVLDWESDFTFEGMQLVSAFTGLV